MADPKPVTLTYVDPEDYTGAYEPQPLAVVGASPEVADKAQIAALTTVTTADATDLATAITLVNALKVRVNQIVSALKA